MKYTIIVLVDARYTDAISRIIAYTSRILFTRSDMAEICQLYDHTAIDVRFVAYNPNYIPEVTKPITAAPVVPWGSIDAKTMKVSDGKSNDTERTMNLTNPKTTGKIITMSDAQADEADEQAIKELVSKNNQAQHKQ